MYEAALAKLNDLHGCWVAGIATILEAEISGEREAAA
jgi:hypothetical protein